MDEARSPILFCPLVPLQTLLPLPARGPEPAWSRVRACEPSIWQTEAPRRPPQCPPHPGRPALGLFRRDPSRGGLRQEGCCCSPRSSSASVSPSVRLPATGLQWRRGRASLVQGETGGTRGGPRGGGVGPESSERLASARSPGTGPLLCPRAREGTQVPSCLRSASSSCGEMAEEQARAL